MLRSYLSALLLVASCAPLEPPPVFPPPPLAGTIGGRPFQPRSALMVEVNHPLLAVSSNRPDIAHDRRSEVKIYESTVTCADVVNESGPPLAPGERAIGVTVKGPWPVAAGTVWPSWTSGSLDAEDSINAAFSVGGSDTGAGATGTIRVVDSSGFGGTFDVALEAKGGDKRTQGSIYGKITFIVCAAPKF